MQSSLGRLVDFFSLNTRFSGSWSISETGILIIFVNLFNHNFFQVTDITYCSILVFLQVYKMDIKLAVLLVFISVIYIANAKPMEEFGKFSFSK